MIIIIMIIIIVIISIIIIIEVNNITQYIISTAAIFFCRQPDKDLFLPDKDFLSTVIDNS